MSVSAGGRNKITKLSEQSFVRDLFPAIHFEPCASQREGLLISSVTIGANTFHDHNVKGKGVIIGIYDSGIHWKHGDFRNADGTSRILYIWDQTIDTLKGKESHPPYTSAQFGVEYTKADIDSELIGSKPGFVRSDDFSGHCTHVAGIAASNGLGRTALTPPGGYVGIAPEADLIIVNGTYDDADVIAGLDYLDQRAKELGKPLAINFSFGGHSEAHDGSSPVEIKINQMFASGKPGRFISTAAGNNGSHQIHWRKHFAAQQSTWDANFSIGSYTPRPNAINDLVEFSFWYHGAGNLNLSVYGPDASKNPTRSFGYFPYNNRIPIYGNFIDSVGYVQVENIFNPSDSMTHAMVIIADIDSNGRIVQPNEGSWKISFTRTRSTASATLDGWYADHPEDWDPSGIHATLLNSDDSASLVVPSTAENTLTVGGFISANQWIAESGETRSFYEGKTLPDNGSLYPNSSEGPTRDGRQKPDIIAPAEAIMAARAPFGFNSPFQIGYDSIHQINSGTSMASPHACGAAALLLSLNPTLDQIQLKQALMNAARLDSYTQPVPSIKSGNGKLYLDYDQMVGLVSAVPLKEENWEVYPNPFNPSTTLSFRVQENNALIKADVFLLNGKRIRDLERSMLKTGDHKIYWDGMDNYGKAAASGVYIMRVTKGKEAREFRLVLMR